MTSQNDVFVVMFHI